MNYDVVVNRIHSALVWLDALDHPITQKNIIKMIKEDLKTALAEFPESTPVWLEDVFHDNP